MRRVESDMIWRLSSRPGGRLAVLHADGRERAAGRSILVPCRIHFFPSTSDQCVAACAMARGTDGVTASLAQLPQFATRERVLSRTWDGREPVFGTTFHSPLDACAA